jgi:tetratricopeptide (TPR) repeat protein
MWLSLAMCVVAAAATAGAPSSVRTPLVDKWAEGAQRFDGLGPLHREVTTGSAEAQAYFDQGLRLLYGFNHDEAARSFARAAQLDPTCASCFWGVALTMGPNYNVPMLPDRAAVAWEALERARALAPSATPVEQALIGALAKRYPGPEPVPPKAMKPFNEAYAAAMRAVQAEFPDDVDVMVLTAEALMDLDPWKLWTLDGKPAPQTPEIVRLLEAALARDVTHPGANHYSIHALEASKQPERALPAAERLGALMPAAGHMVHMPAHIFQRVGRYADASESNRRAIEADKRYLALTKPPGYYPMYIGHNWGFLAFSASMEGRAEETLVAAREAAKALPPEMIAMMPGMDYFSAEPLLAMVRFARWDELLAEPRPDPKWTVMTALWLHAHGMALAAKGRVAEAARDHAELVALRRRMPAEMMAGNAPARDVAAVGAKILEARIAEARRSPRALGLWAEAVALEDQLAYNEPAEWFYPARHFQGAALLAAGRAREAEAVYREDLRRNPNNGWALSGLAAALRAQGKDATAVERAFRQAWSRADVTLTSSIL